MMPISCCQTGTSVSFIRGTLTLLLNGLLIFFLCIAALFTQPAVAANFWADGYLTPATKNWCFAANSEDLELRTYAGYLTDGSTFPKTGEVAYVHAVGYNISGCAFGESFGPEFFLPDGASFAISANNPVYCLLSKPGVIAPFPVPTNPNGSCSQSYTLGNHGGAFFGWATLAPGWQLEVQVPYIFNKSLLGLAGGAGSVLNVASSAVNPPKHVYPSQAVTVYYQASFQNLASSSITASSASLAFDLLNYYHGGSLYIDYGTTNPPASSIASPPISSNALSYPISSNLSGLAASTTYFWRARFVMPDGTTFTSTPIQSFTTSGGAGPQTLTVSNAGTGAGRVTSSPTGINCVTTCSASFNANSSVTLTAAPAVGSTFSGWRGAGCSGIGACVVTMSAAQSVTATFTSSGTPMVTVTKAGDGFGTVTSDPPGIDCGKYCMESFTSRESVVLTATAKAGSTFSGWKGRGLIARDCGVDVICTLPSNTAQTVTATFVLAVPQTLTVLTTGTGTGTVTSSPGGISCGATCNADFTASSGVILTAMPTTGSIFTGWNGAGCSGVDPCTVTMGSAQSVSATLMREIGSLNITLDGLPASSTVLLGITGPGGLNTTHNSMTGTGFNLSDVSTGTYTVTPPTVKINGRTYTAPPQSVVVNSGSTPATINIVYSVKATDLTPILMLLLD